MVITHSQLPLNNGHLPLPFFGGDCRIFLFIIFINDCIYILTDFLDFFMVVYVILKIEVNNNSPILLT